MNVVIGIDPHKASHTAVAIDEDEDELSSVRVCATRLQVEQLMRWAEPFEHSPHRALIGRPDRAPGVAAGQPQVESRHPHGCHQPDPTERLSGPGLLRAHAR